MMLALLSDLHANLQAVQACLRHARDHGATRFAVLGDIVGYGADPSAVVDVVRELHEQGATVLKGNHDEMAVQPPAQALTQGAQTAQWTHDRLSGDQRAFLQGLPLTAADGAMLLVHASADDPGRWDYVDNPRKARASLDAASEQDEGVRYVFGGHVHHQHLHYRGRDGHLTTFNPLPGVAVPVPTHRHWLATVGSVGQPRDGDPRAMYALMDLRRRRLTFHRVAYDHYAAARAVRRVGLPEKLAHRLEVGR